MAKMFYTLEEAAEKIGVNPDEVKAMAADGKLQQFRDRDKLMFKREQVDALAGGGADLADESSGPIPLASSGDTDAIDLKDESFAPLSQKKDPRDSTGISVFDTGEMEAADPAALTQVTQPADNDLIMDSGGSGSGLLDLTHESDDTSLGAELLDEIYPGGTKAGASKLGASALGGTELGGTELGGTELGASALGGSGVGASGIFESAIAMDAGQTAPSGLANLQASGTGSGAQPTAMPVSYQADDSDAAGNGFSVGMLVGATVALVLGLIVAMGALAEVETGVTNMMADSLLIWTGGLLVGSFILGFVGMGVGKALGR